MLHERRVVHGDVEARHVFPGPSGEVTLIDFDRAQMGATDWAIEREKAEVERCFVRGAMERAH